MPEADATPTRPLRYGLIGAGTMGQEHVRYTELLDGVQVVAIADPHAPSVQSAIAQISHDVATYVGTAARIGDMF